MVNVFAVIFEGQTFMVDTFYSINHKGLRKLIRKAFKVKKPKVNRFIMFSDTVAYYYFEGKKKKISVAIEKLV